MGSNCGISLQSALSLSARNCGKPKTTTLPKAKIVFISLFFAFCMVATTKLSSKFGFVQVANPGGGGGGAPI